MLEPTPLEESDELWVARALQDPQAYEELVRRYQSRLYNLACRLTGDQEEAQDLAQEALIRAYNALARFRQGERFSPWIYKIATNLCINYLRRRRFQVPLDEEAPFVDGALTPEQALEREETRVTVQEAILTLPDQYRAVVLLRHQQELSYSDIASALGLPLGTVKTHLFRAREMLNKILSQELGKIAPTRPEGGKTNG